MSRVLRRRQRPAAQDGAFGAAGWLFAELALVLAIVAFASERPGRIDSAPGKGSGVAPSSAAPPTAVAPEGLSLTSQTMVIAVPANGNGVIANFQRQLDALVGPNARVGLVLIFGVSRTGEPRQGVAVARLLRDLIKETGIRQLPGNCDIRAYFGDASDGQPGDALVEIFSLNGPG